MGDGGLAQSPIPQSPIPNPQSPLSINSIIKIKFKIKKNILPTLIPIYKFLYKNSF
jgi:hypothetical protein